MLEGILIISTCFVRDEDARLVGGGGIGGKGAW